MERRNFLKIAGILPAGIFAFPSPPGFSIKNLARKGEVYEFWGTEKKPGEEELLPGDAEEYRSVLMQGHEESGWPPEKIAVVPPYPKNWVNHWWWTTSVYRGKCRMCEGDYLYHPDKSFTKFGNQYPEFMDYCPGDKNPGFCKHCSERIG